jgi:hypothetical protein
MGHWQVEQFVLEGIFARPKRLRGDDFGKAPAHQSQRGDLRSTFKRDNGFGGGSVDTQRRKILNASEYRPFGSLRGTDLAHGHQQKGLEKKVVGKRQQRSLQTR